MASLSFRRAMAPRLLLGVSALLLLLLAGCSPVAAIPPLYTCFPAASLQATVYAIKPNTMTLSIPGSTLLEYAFVNVSDVSLVIQSSVAPPSMQLLLAAPAGPPTVLWNVTFPALAVGSAMTLALKGDGNLILYGGPGGTTVHTIQWQSNTCTACGSSAAIGLLFSADYPYMQFFNSTCGVVWTPPGALPRPAAQAAPPALGAGRLPFKSRKSLPLSYFYRTFGVNTHFAQGYGGLLPCIQMLQYLGASTIRDGLSVHAMSSFQQVAAAGFRLNLVTGGGPNMTLRVAQAETLVRGLNGMVSSLTRLTTSDLCTTTSQTLTRPDPTRGTPPTAASRWPHAICTTATNPPRCSPRSRCSD